MKRVIETSKAWTAVVVIGVVLAGCGGGSSSSAGSVDGSDDRTSSFDSGTSTEQSGGGETVMTGDTDTGSDTGSDTGTNTGTNTGTGTGSGSGTTTDTGTDTPTDAGSGGSDTGLEGSTSDGSTVEESTGTETPAEPEVTGTATLNWVAPATREDGESLAMGELDSYIVHYGQDAADLSSTVAIADGSTMQYTIDKLSPGEWFFSIQVVDTNGLISAPSALVSKTI